jgi:RimJ/RimL family protein N-acetyltransferase
MILKSNNFPLELHSFGSVKKSEIAKDYLAWLNDLEVVKPIASPILLKPKSLDFIDESYARFTQENCRGFFIKTLPENKFIGTVKLDKIDSHNNSGEIGIMIGNKNMWGKGIATQAFEIMLFFAFNDLKLHRVYGGTGAKNNAMKKVFLTLGFKEEGILRDANKIDEKYSDTNLYSILESEFFSRG